MRFYYYFLFLFFIAINVFSESRIQRTISVEHGLAQSQIQWIHEDRNGYLWFATKSGVSRWDGINFVNYSQESGLSDNYVNCIIEGKDGVLYFGTSRGVSIFNKGIFTTLDEKSGLLDNIVTCLSIDNNETLYIGTYRGLNIYKNGKMSSLTENDGLTSNRIISLACGNDSTLFIGTTDNGFCIYKNEKFEIYDKNNGLLDNYIGAIYFNNDSTVYFCTQMEVGIYMNNKLTTRKYYVRNYIHSGQIIQRSENGTIYFLIENIIYLFQNNQFSTLDLSEEIGQELNAIYLSDNGTLYIGTDGLGVKVYRPGRFMTIDKRDGLSDNTVTGITGDNVGTVFLGTWGCGIGVFQDNEVKMLTRKQGLKSEYILCVHYGSDGKLYSGTNCYGVDVYKDGKCTNLSLEDYNYVRVIHEGSDGTMYFGSMGGVWSYKNQKLGVFYKSDNISQNNIKAIYESKNKNIFIGTLDGLLLFKNNSFKVLKEQDGLAGNSINCIYESRDSSIYIGTTTGLTVLKNGNFNIINTIHGLSDNFIYSIIEDDSGKIYAATNRGINVISFFDDQYKIRTLRRTDGLVRDELEINSVYKDRSGRLWFGTTQGACCYDPKFDPENPIPPKVYITNMRLYDKEISPCLPQQTMLFDYDENYFHFEYIGIDLNAPEKVKYHYYMSGIDKNWIETNQRFVQYTNLNDGAYTFNVKARNEWGYWSEPSSIQFTINPPFWETWWFRILVLLILAFLLWVLHHYRVKRLVEFERLRTRIASDLHDDIGVMLTNLSVYAETIKSTESDINKIKITANKVGILARQILGKFSDIVWSIDSRNDTLKTLLTRMKDIAFQILDPFTINFSFKTDGLELGKFLSPDIRKNIYLIYKEALNNIARHSGASIVEIIFKKVNDKLILRIHDNGVNDWKDQETNGNGLRNMKLRANQINASIKVENTKGSTVLLTVDN